MHTSIICNCSLLHSICTVCVCTNQAGDEGSVAFQLSNGFACTQVAQLIMQHGHMHALTCCSSCLNAFPPVATPSAGGVFAKRRQAAEEACA